MHRLCYYCHLHIISSGVFRASCFTGGVAYCLHFTHHNVATLSMLFMLCALLLLLLTFQPSSTFPWILSTISLFHTLLSVATTLHFLIVYGVNSCFLLCASTKTMKVEAPCSTMIKFEIYLFFNIPVWFFLQFMFLFLHLILKEKNHFIWSFKKKNQFILFYCFHFGFIICFIFKKKIHLFLFLVLCLFSCYLRIHTHILNITKNNNYCNFVQW